MKIFSLLPFILVSIFINYSVELQDGLTIVNLQASISAPADLVVTCDNEIDTSKLKSTNQDYYGTIIREKNKRLFIQSKVCESFCDPDFFINSPIGQIELNQIACELYKAFYDQNNPSKQYNLYFGNQGYYEGYDTFKIRLNDRRKCGLGLIQRVFTGLNNNIDIASDTQNIWVIPCSRFFIDEQNLCNPDDDLIWNSPYCDTNYILKLSGCNESIDSTATPRLKNIECSLLSSEYNDKIVSASKPACFIIHRTISIIDWCIYDPFIDPKKGRYSFTQKIEITDRNKPVVTCDVGPCEPVVLINGQCHAPIKLTATANDNCSPSDWLLWEYKIDLFNDGVGKYNGYDLQVGKLSKKSKQNGDTLEVADNPYDNNTKDPFDASGTYPLGVHKICWFVEDGCGNLAVCCTLFEVKDCVPPVIKSIKDTIVYLGPQFNHLVYAKDLVDSVFELCSNKSNLIFYFNNDRNFNAIAVDCSSPDFNFKCGREAIFDLELFVEDENANSASSWTKVIVIDRDISCPSELNSKLKLNIRNTKNYKISTNLYHNFTENHLVGNTNCFRNFTSRACINTPLTIVKKSYYGTDVLDLILLNEHILGKSQFKYFEYYAGDLNRNNGITSSDKSILTKLILDRQMKDWKFFQKEDSIPLKDFNTFSCPDSCNIIGIMNGDVSLDALTGCNDTISNPKECISFEIKDEDIFINNLAAYPVFCRSKERIKGFQLDLKIPFKNSTIMGISSNYPNLEFHLSNNRIGDSLVRIICLETNGNNFLPDPNKPLFILEILSRGAGKFSEFFQLDNMLQENTAYDLTNSKYNICWNYSTVVQNLKSLEEIILYPNPNNGQFIIAGEDVNLIQNIQIINNDGKIIQSILRPKISSDKIEIKTNLESGLYFCKINLPSKSIIKKLIILRQ